MDIQKYNIKINGIIHIGAHELQEQPFYKNMGVSKIIWIEANPLIVKRNLHKISNDELLLNALITEKDDSDVDFRITNSDSSSSVLELDHHKKIYPHIYEVDKVKMKSITLSTLLLRQNINPDDFNYLHADVQGAELMVLKGYEKNIPKLSIIGLEVNNLYLYKNCALINEIDEYLLKFGFDRVETHWIENNPNLIGWGDALYIKQ
jgi:FkbM family methyltransferase